MFFKKRATNSCTDFTSESTITDKYTFISNSKKNCLVKSQIYGYSMFVHVRPRSSANQESANASPKQQSGWLWHKRLFFDKFLYKVFPCYWTSCANVEKILSSSNKSWHLVGFQILSTLINWLIPESWQNLFSC